MTLLSILLDLEQFSAFLLYKDKDSSDECKNIIQLLQLVSQPRYIKNCEWYFSVVKNL